MWMSILSLSLLLAVGVSMVNSECAEVPNCQSCSNPGLACYGCPIRRAMKWDNSGCVDCPDNCWECETVDSNNNLKCLDCYNGYVLTAQGVCLPCSEYCYQCNITTGEATVCNQCFETYGNSFYILSTRFECIPCPKDCEICTETLDYITTCSKCREGFYRNAAGDCKRCPSQCVDCRENADGKAECSKCNDNWEVNIDDPTKSCLYCPVDRCTSCIGYSVNAHSECLSCVDGRGLVVRSGECEDCTPNCVNCDGDSSCGECEPFYREDSGICDPCPTFCRECSLDADSIEQCDLCDISYVAKLSQVVTCDQCPVHCSSCISREWCATCDYGWINNAGNGVCLQCPSNCKYCDYKNGKAWCKSNECEVGYAYNGNEGTCHGCPTGCEKGCLYNTTSDVTYCVSCNNSITRYGQSEANQCYECPSNCDSCSYNDTLQRTMCNDGQCKIYYEDVLGDCRDCPLACKSCVWNDVPENDRTECNTLCDDGYYNDVDTNAESRPICFQCAISSCQICANDTFCTDCFTGFDTSVTSEECLQCPSYCTLCHNDGTDNTLCETCLPYYGRTLDFTTCTACTTNCKDCYEKPAGQWWCKTGECDLDYVINSDDGSCRKCPSNCETCKYDSPTKKTWCDTGKCFDGWARNPTTGQCDKCDAPCVFCTYNSDGTTKICSDCEDYYVLDSENNACLDCPDHCRTCFIDETGSTQCTANMWCDNYYGLKADGGCYDCPLFCVDCTADAETDILYCDNCRSGYRANSAHCAACPLHCDVCIESGGSLDCQTCEDRYAKDPEGICVKCPANCLSCRHTSTSTFCDECSFGFGLVADKTTCEACSTLAFDRCRQCSDANPLGQAACFECDGGWTLKEDDTECLDASALTSEDCTWYQDRPYVCTAEGCNEGYEYFDFNGQCGMMCWQCGNLMTGDLRPESECGPVHGESFNYTAAHCDHGTSCWVMRQEIDGQVLVARGCHNQTCDEKSEPEHCEEVDGAKMCGKCCVGDGCNIWQLDGKEGSAAATISAFLLTMALIFALFTKN